MAQLNRHLVHALARQTGTDPGTVRTVVADLPATVPLREVTRQLRAAAQDALVVHPHG